MARIGGFMGTKSEGFELGIKRWLLAHEARAQPLLQPIPSAAA